MSLLPKGAERSLAADVKALPAEVRRLFLAGRCMAHELEMAGMRPDLVEAWGHCLEEIKEKDIYG